MIKTEIATLIHSAIEQAQAGGALPPFAIPEIPVERPKQSDHGDLATPVSLQLARVARAAPRKIAEIIVAHLPPVEYVGKVEIAGPGYINLHLADPWLSAQVDTILQAGETYGNVDVGGGESVQVEFVSANPTGPLHVGSARNAVIGDAVANVLEAANYRVQREYYVNDAGTQMELFGASLYARYAQALGREEPMPERGYQGAYMIEMGKRAADEYGTRYLEMDREQAIPALIDVGLAYMLDSIRHDLGMMGVHFDCWFSERTLYSEGTFDLVLAKLREAGYIEERDGAVWFAATKLGGDKDEVVIRSTGDPGYFASDIAYHYNKFVQRGFQRVIDVWGADHQGHVPRMHEMLRALGIDPQRLTIIIYQLVTLKRSGEIVRLSKRTGDIVTLREVLEEVGSDAVRFFLVSRGAESQMDFDLDLAKEQSNENPVYYVQYAHARISSILRLAAERGLDYQQGEVALLTHPMELGLIRHMLQLPETIDAAARALEPHHLAHYAVDLAGQFHGFYRDCRVVSSEESDRAISLARLKLVRAAQIVLARVLHLMGMAAPEQM